MACVVKRVKTNEVESKSKGNRKQFEHEQQVLNCLTDAQHFLANAKYEKAKRAIEEGITLTEKRIKVIKLADPSEFGWSTVSEDLSDELGSNSEDENAFSAQRSVLSVVLSKQYVDVRFQRGARGLLLIPVTLSLQGLPQRVGFV